VAISRRVLIADDDPDIGLLLATALDNRGYETRVERTGADALEAVRDWQPDLAILDVMMPKMHGFAVCRELKSSPETRGVRVLILTAKAYDADKRLALDSGADAYLTKPFDIQVLVSKVAELTSRP
jgi:DNA-binding response OmpR family regulator